MRNIFTTEAIMETETYKSLVSKKEQCKVNILLQRIVRERITHAFWVYQNTGTIPTTVKYMEVDVVNDLIRMRNE